MYLVFWAVAWCSLRLKLDPINLDLCDVIDEDVTILFVVDRDECVAEDAAPLLWPAYIVLTCAGGVYGDNRMGLQHVQEVLPDCGVLPCPLLWDVPELDAVLILAVAAVVWSFLLTSFLLAV